MFTQQAYSGALNIHSDPRVARGSTTRTLQLLTEENKRKTSGKRKSQGLGSNTTPLPDISSSHAYYKYKTSNFVDNSLDLSKFLTEPDFEIETKDHGVQTTGMFPPIRNDDYIPPKNGVDASTCIQNQSDLFKFDLEVQPLLNVIVSKTLEQALVELAQDAEIRSIRHDVAEEHRKKRVEHGEIAEIAAADQLAAQTKVAEMRKYETDRAEQCELLRKTACVYLAREMAQIAEANALSDLAEEFDEWKSPAEQIARGAVVKQIIPNVMEAVDLRCRIVKLLDGMVAESAQNASHYVSSMRPRRSSVVRLHISKNVTGGEFDIDIGPIPLNPDDTIDVAEEKIMHEITRLGLSDRIKTSKGLLRDFLSLQGDFKCVSDISRTSRTEINVNLT